MKLEGHQRTTIMIDLNTLITLLESLILRNKLKMGPRFCSHGSVAVHTSFLILFVFPW